MLIWLLSEENTGFRRKNEFGSSDVSSSLISAFEHVGNEEGNEDFEVDGEGGVLSSANGGEMSDTLTNAVKLSGVASVIFFSFNFNVSFTDSYIVWACDGVILFLDVKLAPRLKFAEILLMIKIKWF